MQQVPGVDNLVVRVVVGGRVEGDDVLGDPVGHLDLPQQPVVTGGHSVYGATSEAGEVPSEQVGRVGGVELGPLDEVGVDPLEPGGELPGDQVFVNARLKIRHRSRLPSEHRSALPSARRIASLR
ncbi:hypothetical protein GCM10012279_04040 [Micromonospora yangpuensis]|nr:hypothetical protein GCM10012279_04040 [Micromonospora yangpuensis]